MKFQFCPMIAEIEIHQIAANPDPISLRFAPKECPCGPQSFDRIAGIANLHFLPAALAHHCTLMLERFRQRVFTTAAIASRPLNRDFILNSAGVNYTLLIIGDPEKARITAYFQNLSSEIFRRLRQILKELLRLSLLPCVALFALLPRMSRQRIFHNANQITRSAVIKIVLQELRFFLCCRHFGSPSQALAGFDLDLKRRKLAFGRILIPAKLSRPVIFEKAPHDQRLFLFVPDGHRQHLSLDIAAHALPLGN